MTTAPQARPPARALRAKFRDAFRGLASAARHEPNVRIHAVVLAAVVGGAAVLQLPALEWSVLLLASGAVLACEMLNTALELIVRALAPGDDPRIRDALNIASAAVLLAAIAALSVAACVAVSAVARGL